MSKVIVKINSRDPVPTGGRFLHAATEQVGVKSVFGPKEDCLSWLWPNPNQGYRHTPIMGTVFYYEVEQAEEDDKV